MKIMPSVISDYENGRRKSPGIKMVKKIVEAMINIDERRGGKIIQDFADLPTKAILSEAVLDMKEFNSPITIKDFCNSIDASVLVRKDLIDKKLYGYTVIDSLKAIMDLSPIDMVKLYGMTSERVLIFTGASSGRSSMVALKVTNLRPGLVILHGSDKLDDLALGTIKTKSTEDFLKKLKRAF
jgi:putative transcriptional regulator